MGRTHFLFVFEKSLLHSLFISLHELCSVVLVQVHLVLWYISSPLAPTFLTSSLLWHSLNSERRNLMETSHLGMCVTKSHSMSKVWLYVSICSHGGGSLTDDGSIGHQSMSIAEYHWGSFYCYFFLRPVVLGFTVVIWTI
jgi:hypothetical protein